MSDTPSYRPPQTLDPRALMRIQSLELRARCVMEGFLTGLHRSPFHGFSVEFSEYRSYVPGDDPRNLDWRLYARSDRYYVKQFEDETNLRCHLAVDVSSSMNYGSLGFTKADYARTLAATFACFLLQQRDAVGLARIDQHLEELIPARFRPGQWRRILTGLERSFPQKRTDLPTALEQLAERIHRRGLVVLISDFLSERAANSADQSAAVLSQRLERTLGQLTARGHDVAVIRIMDPAEVDFSFTDSELFIDMETGQELSIDPIVAGENYRRRFAQHREEFAALCGRLGIPLQEVVTSQPLETVLADFLNRRPTRTTAARNR